MRLLEEAALSLEECAIQGNSSASIARTESGNLHRSISIVFDRLDLNLPSTHDGQCRSEKL
jgi:hypothetical protein